MSKPRTYLIGKALWIVAAVLACSVGWQQYRAWQRYKLSQKLWDVVQGCQQSSANSGVTFSCNPLTVRNLLAQGASVHYTPESSGSSLFIQTPNSQQEAGGFGTSSMPEQRAFVQQQMQFATQMRPLRRAVANLLLDAWLVDHARKVRLDASQELQETTYACKLALKLNRPELLAPLLDTNVQVDVNELLLNAIEQGQLGAVKTLVQRGAALEHPTNGVDSALLCACIVTNDTPNKMNIIKFLLEKGADVNHLDVRDRGSILQAAASYGSDTLALLLAHGAKVNVQDTQGYTALMQGASIGSEASVKMLLAHGANPNLRTKEGETALSRAIENKHPEVARLLQQAGAKQ